MIQSLDELNAREITINLQDEIFILNTNEHKNFIKDSKMFSSLLCSEEKSLEISLNITKNEFNTILSFYDTFILNITDPLIIVRLLYLADYLYLNTFLEFLPRNINFKDDNYSSVFVNELYNKIENVNMIMELNNDVNNQIFIFAIKYCLKLFHLMFVKLESTKQIKTLQFLISIHFDDKILLSDKYPFVSLLKNSDCLRSAIISNNKIIFDYIMSISSDINTLCQNISNIIIDYKRYDMLNDILHHITLTNHNLYSIIELVSYLPNKETVFKSMINKSSFSSLLVYIKNLYIFVP